MNSMNERTFRRKYLKFASNFIRENKFFRTNWLFYYEKLMSSEKYCAKYLVEILLLSWKREVGIGMNWLMNDCEKICYEIID